MNTSGRRVGQWLLVLLAHSAWADETCATSLVQKKAQARFAATKSVAEQSRQRTPWDLYDYVVAVQHKSGAYLIHKVWLFMFSVLGAGDADMGTWIQPCYYDMCHLAAQRYSFAFVFGLQVPLQKVTNNTRVPFKSRMWLI